MNRYPILDRVNSPQDVKDLSRKDLSELCSEVREFLVEHVAKTGGHLASNLGVVELTVALHRVFDTPRDSIVCPLSFQHPAPAGLSQAERPHRNGAGSHSSGGQAGEKGGARLQDGAEKRALPFHLL